MRHRLRLAQGFLQAFQQRRVGANLCSYGNQTARWANRKCLITSCQGIPGGAPERLPLTSLRYICREGLGLFLLWPRRWFPSIPLSRLEQQRHLRVGGVRHPGASLPPYCFCCLRTESVPESRCQSVCPEFNLLARLIIGKQTFPEQQGVTLNPRGS